MTYRDALENYSIHYSYKTNICMYLLFIFLTFYMCISFLFCSRNNTATVTVVCAFIQNLHLCQQFVLI